MYKFLILLFLLSYCCEISSEAYADIRYPVGHINKRHEYLPKIPNENLSALEKYSLNRTYPKENTLRRLERLENNAFGAVQYGDILNRYRNVESALLSRPTNYGQYKRSALGTLADYFGGRLTGYTPQINQNSAFSPYSYNNYGSIYPSQNYGTQRIDQFSNGIFGGGYSIRNQAFGNGSSIRILD
ncbi:MAG: hypothetical protein MJ237_05190 [bacterium]|nr:hypothetical protein [bacterium]